MESVSKDCKCHCAVTTTMHTTNVSDFISDQVSLAELSNGLVPVFAGVRPGIQNLL